MRCEILWTRLFLSVQRGLAEKVALNQDCVSQKMKILLNQTIQLAFVRKVSTSSYLHICLLHGLRPRYDHQNQPQ
jgi:hypothetical protein